MPTALDVLFPLPIPPLRYLAPYGRPVGPCGARVVVPWQGGVRIGLVVAVTEVGAGVAMDLKEIVDWLDAEPFLIGGAPEVIDDLARYSGSPPGVVLASLVPIGFKDALIHEVRPVEGATTELSADRWLAAERLDADRLELLRSQGLLLERARRRVPTVRVLQLGRPADDALEGAARANQRRALLALERRGFVASGAELAREAEVPDSAVRALVAKGYAEYREVPAPPPTLPSFSPLDADEGVEPAARPAPLPPGGAASLSGGLRRDRIAALLPGLLADLAAGASVTVLVPEGALLAETAALLAGRLPLLTLSGDLSDVQRQRVWDEVRAGPPRVLLATYLGLLAPVAALGRLVVLEAGSSTYKLPAGPRLFVPTAAGRLAATLELPIVFADTLLSADLRQALPRERQLRLPLRRPRLHVASLAGESGWPLSADLARVLKQVAERERQAVLIAPRRGYSAALGCPDCGWHAGCPNCDLPLRYHQSERRLRCHQCGYQVRPPLACPACAQAGLGPLRGAGTQWIGSALRRLLPELPVYRVDGDQHDDLADLYAGRPGVVVGTTSVLRLAPLPSVSLLAITLLDTYLNLADYRAEEETLRLLLNLGNLAPRRHPLLVVQTFQDDHPLLDLFRPEGDVEHDLDAAIDGFLDRVLERRKRFGYPPFTHLGKIQLSGRDAAATEAAARHLAASLQADGAKGDEVIGPAPAPVKRIRGQYAYQLFIRSARRERFAELLVRASGRVRSVKVRVDVDPRDVGQFLDS